jgi:transcriptional regulator with XRE-family HTH domain
MATEFGDNLKRLMEERKLTGRALAKKLGVPYKTVQEWVGPGGRIPRTPDTLKKLYSLFQSSILLRA